MAGGAWRGCGNARVWAKQNSPTTQLLKEKLALRRALNVSARSRQRKGDPGGGRDPAAIGSWTSAIAQHNHFRPLQVEEPRLASPPDPEEEKATSTLPWPCWMAESIAQRRQRPEGSGTNEERAARRKAQGRILNVGNAAHYAEGRIHCQACACGGV